MKIFYNIITGLLFTLVDMLQSGAMQFVQYENRRDRLVGVDLDLPRYYLQYDSDTMSPRDWRSDRLRLNKISNQYSTTTI